MVSYLSGYVEAAPKRGRREVKKRHAGGYPARANMDLMDPGEIDEMKREHGLMRHHKERFKTIDDVVDGDQFGAIGTGDFRDSIDERELVEAVIDGEHLDRIGEIDSRVLLEHPRKDASLLLSKEKCDCDQKKGQSCMVCCVKIAPTTVCIIARTREGENLYKAEISDDQARRRGFLRKHELLELRKAFFRNNGRYAVLQNN